MPSRSPLRRTIQIAIWTLLLVALLGPHAHWSICLTGKCAPRAEVMASTDCDCCHATPDAGKGDGENGHACPGCCIDLATAIDEGPMPKRVVVPEVQHETAAILPPPAPDAGSIFAARHAGHDTGPPPRVDRRTALIATTILRE